MKGYRLTALLSPLRGADSPPPLAALEPLLDRAPGRPGGHWYWEGDENRHHEPVVSWKPPGAAGAGRYPVARALFEHLCQVVPPFGSLRSLCGVVACVNPEHWELETREQRDVGRRMVVRRGFGL